MSFITDIRTYFDTKIKSVDPDLEFIDDPFGNDDIENVLAEKFYKLYFGQVDTDNNGNIYTELIPITLEIYAPRQRDITTSFDDIYCKAIDIKNAVINPLESKNQAAFNEIFARFLTPESLQSDDNTIRIKLEFNILRDLKF